MLLPAKNRASVEHDVPADLRQDLVIHFAATVEAAMELVFEAPLIFRRAGAQRGESISLPSGEAVRADDT